MAVGTAFACVSLFSSNSGTSMVSVIAMVGSQVLTLGMYATGFLLKNQPG